jgi:hypothetical protein
VGRTVNEDKKTEKVQAYLGWSPRVQVLTPVQMGYTHLSQHHLEDIAVMIGDMYG